MNLIMAAEQMRLGGNVFNLFESLETTAGLTINQDGELYAPASLFPPGDGEGVTFRFKSSTRMVKSIEAHFRYGGNLEAFSILGFLHITDPVKFILGIHDGSSSRMTHRVVSDQHNDAQLYSFNGILKRTFEVPVPLNQLAFTAGGRAGHKGYRYSPIYMSNFKIEFAG